ncbi:MAG: hypothetical protein EXS13_01565 [Planctomycetes bacterium]|nr:hypothetical protein [Planctomycetota bacterium]
MKQARYDALLNQEPYIAQVDEAACGMDGGDAGSQAGGDVESLSSWVVESRRRDSQSPQTVRFWVPQGDDGDGDSTIWAKLRIHRGVDLESPFGRFDLNFVSLLDAAPDPDDSGMYGRLGSVDSTPGTIGFDFFENHGDVTAVPPVNGYARVVQATVHMAADRTSGFARVTSTQRSNFLPFGDSGPQVSEYLLAFDDAHLLRATDGGPPIAFARADFDERAWRYNLYHCSGPDAGQRVELNSGFPIRTDDGEYGYLGYYGIWTPSQRQFVTDDVVEQVDFGNDVATAYSLLVAPGRLSRFVRDTIDLNDLGATAFQYIQFPAGLPPTTYQVLFTGGQFVKIAELDQNTREFIKLEPPVAIDTAALGFVPFYSPALGGPVFYKDGDTFVTVYVQSFVEVGDSLFSGGPRVRLEGLVQCFASDVPGFSWDAGEIYLGDSNDPAGPHAYYFDEATLTLNYDFNGDLASDGIAGLASGQTVTGGPFQWGARSGPLLPSTAALGSVAELFDQPEFFIWECGPNSWNQHVTALDGNGSAVAFDPPLQFTYTHLQANDRNDDPTFDGSTYLFQYEGPGQLHGIPSGEIDLDGDSIPDRWYPLFTLADGVMVGPTGTEYVVKAMKIEQTLAIDAGGAPGLDLLEAAALTLPDGSKFVTPDNGPTPVVTDPPAVIAGELQGTLGDSAGG